MRRKGKKKQDKIDNDDEKKEEQYPTPKDDGNEGVIAFCPCKTQMVPVRADTIYESFVPVFCNDCWCHIAADATAYHCTKGTKGRCWDHPIGYDICQSCAKKQMENRQNAVNAPNQNKGKNRMKKLFNRNKKDTNDELKQNNINNDENMEKTIGSLNINISPTLQCILTQQLWLQQRPNNVKDDTNTVSHLSVIDEITRLSALSNSTLSQIAYSNKNDKTLKHSLGDLQAMIIKYNALQQLQDKLIKSIHSLCVDSYKMIEQRLDDWRNWNKYEFYEWIRSLDAGRFYKKYCVKIDSETDEVNIVKQSIFQQNICGKHMDLDDKRKDILIQSLGINDFDDRLALLDHIQNVVNGTFKYDQTLALVPPKHNEIPGHEQQLNTIEDNKENNEIKQEQNDIVNVNNDIPGSIVEIEGVDLNKNDAK